MHHRVVRKTKKRTPLRLTTSEIKKKFGTYCYQRMSSKKSTSRNVVISVGVHRLATTGGISVLRPLRQLSLRRYTDMEDIKPFNSFRAVSSFWVACYMNHVEVASFLLKTNKVDPIFQGRAPFYSPTTQWLARCLVF